MKVQVRDQGFTRETQPGYWNDEGKMLAKQGAVGVVRSHDSRWEVAFPGDRGWFYEAKDLQLPAGKMDRSAPPRFVVIWDENGSDPLRWFPTKDEAMSFAKDLAKNDRNTNIMVVEAKHRWELQKRTVVGIKTVRLTATK